LNEIGVLASVLEPLAQAGVSILASSTFDTDYFFVPMAKEKDAKKALLMAGHRIE
jgi:hypothetical protein